MKKFINGRFIDMSAEEVSAYQKAQMSIALAERSSSFSLEEVTAMLIRQQISTLAVDDQTALRMVEFYPEWTAGQACAAGYKVQHGGKLWRCLQAHTSQPGWEPSTDTASLWTEICESHDGTLADPIPYDGNMALESGKYYIQDYTIYLCTRDTGNPVYNALSELVGIYVETV